MASLQITHLKLEWLRRRRDELRGKYDAIATRAEAAAGVTARLEVLRAGLSELRAGTELLHPEVTVLEDALPLGGGAVSLDIWRQRLEQELAWGRARAEFGWLFAGLIEEWVATAGSAAARGRARAAEATPVTGVDAPFDLAAIEQLIDDSPRWQKLGEQIARFEQDEVGEPPAASFDVEHALAAIAGGPYRSHELRRQARAVAADETLRGEYAGALALMLDGFTTWQWPAAGVPTRVVEAIDRFRTYLDPELLEALFVELVGARWAAELATKLVEVGRTAERTSGELVDRLYDVLDDRTHLQPFHSITEAKGSSHYVSADAVFDAPDSFEAWLAAVHRRIHGLRAIHPDRPVFVAVADLTAMGPSIPHEVLDRVAQRIGVSAAWRGFFARYLAVPIRDAAGEVVPCRRGIYPDQLLALSLAELVLAAIELRIQELTGVRVVRLVDDFAFVTSDPTALANAWRVFHELVGAAGLTPKPEKCCGMTVFGDAALPPGISPGIVRAGHLVLGGDGSWSIDQAAIDRAFVELRRRVHACASLFEAAQVFSDGVRLALRRMSPFAPFGIDHVRALARVIARFYDELDGPGAGIVAHLISRMTARMPDVDVSSIPSGVWFWPRTAGGVGLFDATVQLAALHAAWRTAPAPAVVPRELTKASLDAFDRSLWFVAMRPRQPPFSADLEGRIADFVRRGDELRGKETDDEKTTRQLRYELNFYWQWIVALHSPTVLARFGTFRFVEASRVPFGAIVELGWLGA